uniref:Large ribosomal subunit protein uL24c n=1 Tax=Cyanidiococcus yangmingshanensis TaxID=2690220 RepID=A0A7G5VUM4_9RHOD|nr:50S ribosomal protein L24 [Cyanidiococcus yangmingshanensis]QMX77391.1 50S ribosomal protein L24 [Cyanidiococcus yangmingshanensis]UNJ16006.1 ribosomal protein L24 [Cyanidioschyzonaceae sp. 3]WDB00503.1 ribosomal protein L24 [Cyanidiococcus yangmingshanensis]
MHIKKGDQVRILSGDDKGKIAEVIKVKNSQVVVKGVNIKTKHVKPKRQGEVGEIKRMEYAIAICKVKIWKE